MATGTWCFSKQRILDLTIREAHKMREKRTAGRRWVNKKPKELDFIVSERVPTASFCFKSLRLLNITFQVLMKAEQSFSLT